METDRRRWPFVAAILAFGAWLVFLLWMAIAA